MDKLIMAWSQCKVLLGPTGAANAFASYLFDVGVIKDKSTTLESSDGDQLKATASGGRLVAIDNLEGGFVLKTTIMEPADDLYVKLGLGAISNDELAVKTHVVSGDFSAKVIPMNVGAKGIKAALCNVKFKPAFAEDAGNSVEMEITIMQALDDNNDVESWYSRFKKKAALTVDNTALAFTNAADTTGETVTATASGTVTASSPASWCQVTVALKVATIKVDANATGAARIADVVISADGKDAICTVTQAAAS